MKTIDNTTRENAYNSAPLSVRSVINDLSFGATLIETAEKNKMNELQERSFINMVGDVVLDLITNDDLKEGLASLSLSPEEIETTLQKLQPYTKKVSDTAVPQANNTLKDKLELRPEGVVPKPRSVEPPQEGAMKPLTRDEVLQALSPKRTMQSDISAIKVDDSE